MLFDSNHIVVIVSNSGQRNKKRVKWKVIGKCFTEP